MKKSTIPALLAMSCAALFSVPAAAETEFELSAGIGSNDNLLRSDVAPVSGTIATAGLGLNTKWDGTRLKGVIDANLAAHHYDTNLLNDEIIGRVSADVSLSLLPERLEWVVTDQFGQVATDPLQPVTARNRQDVNVFSTGPQLSLRFSDVTRLELGARYNNVAFGATSGGDYTGWTGAVALARQLSATGTLSANFNHENVEFEDPLLASYDRQHAYVQYQLTGARTKLEMALGSSKVDRTNASQSEPLARISLERQTTPRTTLTLSAEHGLLTGGEVFRNISDITPGTLSGGGIGDSALQTLYTATWTANLARTVVQLTVLAGEEDYSQANARDIERQGFRVLLQRELTPRLTGRVGLRLDKREFLVSAREQDDTEFELGLERRITDRLALALDYTHGERDDSIPAGSYDENIVFLSLRWRSAATAR